MKRFRYGDRVMRADAGESSVPAYRHMRGTVVGFDWTRVLVEWDCDGGIPSVSYSEDLMADSQTATAQGLEVEDD